MNYTNKLFEFALINFIPFGDRIVESTQSVEKESHHSTASSKNQEKARIATAIKIKKAVKAGKVDPSFAKIANEMRRKGISKLSELNYSKKQYTLNQMSKALPFVGFILPGVDKPANAVIKGMGARNLVQYSQKSSNFTDSAVKTAKFIIPILVGFTSNLWMPYITPMLDPQLIVGVATGIIGSALTLDCVDYLYNNSTIRSPASS